MARTGAIVAAAGRGSRFGAGRNKVFSLLGGRPLLYWSLRALELAPSIHDVVIAAGGEDQAAVAALVREAGFQKVRGLCEGGAERPDTVRSGLRELPPAAAFVAVHDGARPLARVTLVESLVAAARAHGAAVPALPVADTLKRSADGVNARETVDRSGLFTVQTPQVFRRDWLTTAYAAAAEAGFTGTDDAAYVERLGHPVRLVPGDRDNVKITLPGDLDHAERLLAARSRTRTGFGYDVHPLVAGRPLVLGGIALDHPVGLDGHSDADVLLHAIGDALLGAACLGDIGLHFPNTDGRYRGASSLALLGEVSRLLQAAGFVPEHVDATLIAEAPKIRPHVDAMRANIAIAVGLSPGQVSVKATTNERLGFVGREEGMAAHAVATVRQVVD
jgi:2-C-methyl-D-erythritol 4-phosphate cytidylyltransferase/2-C-methyl-D-erythritol 2,4-cyclodiphosphate synthase